MTIIFDLDGTLLNTINDLGYACNHALEACGFPTHPIEEYPRLVGNGVNKLIERALPEGEKTEETVLRVREFFVPYYDAHNCDSNRKAITSPLPAINTRQRRRRSSPISSPVSLTSSSVNVPAFPANPIRRLSMT